MIVISLFTPQEDDRAEDEEIKKGWGETTKSLLMKTAKKNQLSEYGRRGK